MSWYSVDICVGNAGAGRQESRHAFVFAQNPAKVLELYARLPSVRRDLSGKTSMPSIREVSGQEWALLEARRFRGKLFTNRFHFIDNLFQRIDTRGLDTARGVADFLDCALKRPAEPDWNLIFSRLKQRGYCEGSAYLLGRFKGAAGEEYLAQRLLMLEAQYGVKVATPHIPCNERHSLYFSGFRADLIDLLRDRRAYEFDSIVSVGAITVLFEVKVGRARNTLLSNLTKSVKSLSDRTCMLSKLAGIPEDSLPVIMMVPPDVYFCRQHTALGNWENEVRHVVPFYTQRSRFEEEVLRECKQRGFLIRALAPCESKRY